MNKISSGKVRDVYDAGENLVLVTTDRMSAYDVIMNEKIPNKGVVLNKISEFWFNLTKDLMPNHLISTNLKDMPEDFQGEEFKGRILLAKKLKMFPVECIVRGYITGSGWSDYLATGEMCGIKLPEGLKESQKLPEPIFTPSTKASEGHDISISFEQAVDLIGEKYATLLKEKSIEIYSKCAEYAYSKGIIIADTKFEFGLDEQGNLVLADEVLTPDSSRFWSLEKYEIGKPQDSFDKQYLRDWLTSTGWNKTPPPPTLPESVISTTAKKYIDSYELLTGEKLTV